MDTKKIAIGVLLATTIVFAVSSFKKTNVVVSNLGGEQKAPIVNVQVPEQPAPIVNVNVPKQTVTSPTLGAATGPELSSPYFTFGGVRQWARKTSMTTGSTTCSIQGPVATSSLVAASASFTNVASTTVMEIGLSSTAFATTTQIAVTTVTGGLQSQLVASSTSNTLIVPPNFYVNTKVGSGAIAGTTNTAGTCIAVFRELQ